MGLIPKIKNPQWSVKKTAAVSIVGLEAIGFMFATERTLNVNKEIGKAGWGAVEAVADKGLEPVVCGALAITPWVEFDGDCIQNIGEDGVTAATETQPTVPPASTIAPAPQVTQTPNAEPDFSLDANHNLYGLMTNAGYSCEFPHIVSAGDGQGYVDLLQNPGDIGKATSEAVVIDAYNQGVFDGLPTLMVGETAVVAACE
jgi:hypothetical protein